MSVSGYLNQLKVMLEVLILSVRFSLFTSDGIRCHTFTELTART